MFSMALAFVGTLILADWQSIGSDPCSDPALNSSSSCENSPFPGDECYWRQRSRVTGKLCLECPSGCASSKKMLNFAQFCGAFLLWVTAVPLVRAVSFIITSDQVGKSEQVSTVEDLFMLWHYLCPWLWCHLCPWLWCHLCPWLWCHLCPWLWCHLCP